MSLPRPSGIKQPTRIGRPSGLPTARPQTPSGGSSTNQYPQNNGSSMKAQSAIAKSARGVGFCPEHADQYATDVSRLLKGPEPLEDGVVTDDFKIGDRIWVSGNKPGTIAFIGETQFAPGDWAGIVLDEGIGKNDGSVMGIRYFQCEPKRGVFSRLSKLSHTPHSPTRPLSQGYDSNSSESKFSYSDFRPSPQAATTNGTSAPGSAASSRPSSRLGLSSSKHLSTSSSSLHKASDITTPPGTASGVRLPGASLSATKLGDRVLVSGSKPGILRFIGETDFAKGVWAGVELDEPLGKNDGAVAGKRYFDCKPLHGLFAPIHKISLADLGITTPSPHSRPLMSTSLRSSRERSGSQESVSSLSSTASSVSRSRVRLGVTSLASQASKSGQRPNTLNLSATTAALQKALKEKEEHIEQLLRERDLERSEVARAAAHVDEAESQLSFIKTEQSKLRMEADDQISKYRALVADLENEKQELLAFLEEEKRKVEDLQFQLEEETLKDDADSKPSAASELQVKELERQVKKEKDRADNLENELSQLKQNMEGLQKAVEESRISQRSYSDQIENLTHKLTQAETKVKNFELNRLEDGAKVSQVSIELTEKQNQVKDLEEQLASQRREMSSVSQQLNDLREELFASNEKRKKQDEHIKELMDKLKLTENQHNEMMDEIRNANSNTADLQRQLAASKTKAEELASERAILETQLSELMKNSGDSSSQLATLNDQLMERTRKLEDLQNDLLNSSQKLAKAEESYQGLVQEKDREIQEVTKHFQDRIVRLEEEISELNSFVEKSKAKASQLSESFESEKKEALDRREAEIRELQQQLSHVNNELAKQQDNTAAHKQLLEKVTLEKEALQYEKQQAEKHLKRSEEEKNSINTELIQARVEASKHLEEVEKSKRVKLELEDKVEQLSLQVECITKAKDEAEKSRDEIKSQKTEQVQANNLLKQELSSLRVEVQKKDTALSDLQKEVETLQAAASKEVEELMYKSQSEMDLVAQELNSLKSVLQETQDQLKSKDAKVSELQSLLDNNKVLIQERDSLEKEKAELLQEKEASEDKCRSFLKEVEKQSHKVADLQSEIQSLKCSEEALKQQKSALEGKVVQLESDLDKARKDAVEARSTATAAVDQSGSAVYVQLNEDAEFASRQVDFLNSVIVELQNKNQQLQTRLSAMEDSGIHTNGELSEVAETATRKRVPPRMFCDICDAFDLHDTEECPRQAMSSSPEPTRHHGDRKSTRPYCDICEVFSELCNCGAFSSQNKTKSSNNDVSLGITLQSPVPTTEYGKFYRPPEGFGRDDKQKFNEHVFQTVESFELMVAESSCVYHGKSEGLNVNPEDGLRSRDYYRGHSTERLLALSDTGENVLAEVCCHSTSRQPDLLQDCDKTLAHLLQTSLDESVWPGFSTGNKQDVNIPLPDKTLADLFRTNCHVPAWSDSSVNNKKIVNTPDTGFCDDFDGEIDTQFTHETGCCDHVRKDIFSKHVNMSRNGIDPSEIEDSWSPDTTSGAILEKHTDVHEHSLDASRDRMCIDSNSDVGSCSMYGYSSNSLFVVSLIHSSEGCDPGSLVDAPQDCNSGSLVGAPKTYDGGSVVDAPECSGSGHVFDASYDVNSGLLVNAPEGCDPDSLVDASQDCNFGLLVDAPESYDRSSVVGASKYSSPGCLFRATEDIDPDSLDESPDDCNPGSLVDAPQDCDSAFLVEIPKTCDPGCLFGATEDIDPGSLVDAPQDCHSGSLVGAPERYNQSSVVGAPKCSGPGSLFDATEDIDPDSLDDAPDDCDPGSLVDAPEDRGIGSFIEAAGSCDTGSLVNDPELCDPGSLVNDPELCDPESLVNDPELCDPGSLTDSSEGCDPDFLASVPEGCVPGFFASAPEGCNPDFLTDAPKNYNPDFLADAPEGCNPDFVVAAPEDYHLDFLDDAPEGCVPGFLAGAPEGYGPECVIDAPEMSNSDCLFDAPEDYEGCFLFDSPEGGGLDFVSDAPEACGLGYLFDIPEECDPLSLVHAPEDCHPDTLAHAPEACHPDSLVDALDSCGFDTLFDIPEGWDLKNVKTKNVNQVTFEENTDGFEDFVPMSCDQTSVNVCSENVSQATLELRDFAECTVEDVSRYHITDRADPETGIQVTLHEKREASGDFIDESTGSDTMILHSLNHVSSESDKALESSVDALEDNSLENAVHENEKESVFKRYFNFARDLLNASGSKKMPAHEQQIVNERQTVSGDVQGILREGESVDPQGTVMVERKRDVSCGFMNDFSDRVTDTADPEPEVHFTLEGSRDAADSMDASRDGVTATADPEINITVEGSLKVTDSMDASRDGVTEIADPEIQITVEGSLKVTDSMDASRDGVTEIADPEIQITVEGSLKVTDSMDASRDGVTEIADPEIQITVEGSLKVTDSMVASRDGVTEIADPEIQITVEGGQVVTDSMDSVRCEQDTDEADYKYCAKQLMDALKDHEIHNENERLSVDEVALKAEYFSIVKHFKDTAKDYMCEKSNCQIDHHVKDSQTCGCISVDAGNTSGALVNQGEIPTDKCSAGSLVDDLLVFTSVSADAISTNNVAHHKDSLADASQDHSYSSADTELTSQCVCRENGDFTDCAAQASRNIADVAHESKIMVISNKCGSAFNVREDHNFKGVQYRNDAGATLYALESSDLEQCEIETKIGGESPRHGSEARPLEYEQILVMGNRKQQNPLVALETYVEGESIRCFHITTSNAEEVESCRQNKDSTIDLQNTNGEYGDRDYNFEPCVSWKQEEISGQAGDGSLEDATACYDNECKDVHSRFEEMDSQSTDWWCLASSGSSNMALLNVQAMNDGRSDSPSNVKTQSGLSGFHQGHRDENSGQSWQDFAQFNHLTGTDLNVVSLRDAAVTDDNKTVIYHGGDGDDSDTDSGTAV